MTHFTTEADAINYVFASINRINWRERGLDENTRDMQPTRRLLTLCDLPGQQREYAIVTGSKGKGSVAAITAKLLQHLGHRVGLVTSPHLTTYRQRFRVNGLMISEADLVRHLSAIKPAIDRVQAELSENKYLSPQGIFLAVALRWFDEQDVTAAVIEVGRGGRYDDNSLVPNALSLFTPIIMEHNRYLGATLDRIAWHKSGIIKPQSYAYSLPQAPEVMHILRAEADKQEAVFEWLAPMDMGQYLGNTENGMRVNFGRYGEVALPLLGLYEIANASLAIWGAGNMHGRLKSDLSHASNDYVARIRSGLEAIHWPGRCQKLQDQPAVYIDGAINPTSAQVFIESVRPRLQGPVVTVLAVPSDRDVAGVYRLFAAFSDGLILTRSARNITINFPGAAEATTIAARYHDDLQWADNIETALQMAIKRVGKNGTVLMAVAQPGVGDAMQHYGLIYEQI